MLEPVDERQRRDVVIPAEGVILERILETTYPLNGNGLNPDAYRRFDAAQMKTAWGRHYRQRMALVSGTDLLASATQYDFEGALDQTPVRVCGVGDVFTEPTHRGNGHGRRLVERLLAAAARDGATVALLFSDLGSTWCTRNGFAMIPTPELELNVTASRNHGAPMTLVRAGADRDLEAIVAMGRVRAAGFRFHLNRDGDLVQHAITKSRLLAGLGPPGARQVQFFIAEEGITAAAYVVLSVVADTWTIEECGDRDASGARVGAILQALLARDPSAERPSIRGWLPAGFVPPQVTIVGAKPSPKVLMVGALGSTGVPPAWSCADDVLYWPHDVF